jgi:DNA-binding LytR/AlgR family response regulator
MKLNCIIVDDEPLSQDVLKEYVEACPELNLLGVCNDALEAYAMLKEHSIELMFLDINMPKLSGIGFVKTLKAPPLVILVTAYPEYALEGYEIDAMDYLLKPVSYERFRLAVNRALERKESQQGATQQIHILLRSNKKDYRIDFNEILYLEAQGDYVRFVTESQSLMVHGTLKEYIAQLPQFLFAQIHKSYVISIQKVNYLEGNSVNVRGKVVPVSLSFKDALAQRLKT